jgi:hypothetical protein
MIDELIAWSKHFRDNFDKMLLFSLVIGLIAVVIHMSHDKIDEDHISWAREITGTVLGGLMGLVTGRALAMAARTKSEVPGALGAPGTPGAQNGETQK